MADEQLPEAETFPWWEHLIEELRLSFDRSTPGHPEGDESVPIAQWILQNAGLVQNAIQGNRERTTRFVSADDLQSSGLLQEANRRFFHPLGMALAISTYPDGVKSIIGIIDSRDDDEGWVFDLDSWPEPVEARADFLLLYGVVEAEWQRRALVRSMKFGWMVQPPVEKKRVIDIGPHGEVESWSM